MRLEHYLKPELIITELSARTKPEVLAEIVDKLLEVYPDLNGEEILNLLLERERLGTTGIGSGIAIPHGKMEGLKEVLLVVARSTKGVDFDSLDHNPVQIIFLLLAPEENLGEHLKILAHISRVLRDQEFRESFLAAKSKEDIYSLLKGV
ncbi:MAG: nitrogen system component [Desulfonauticus sp.]|jgi:PTS system nitrogen regulatory IIA component|nr:nitrogen system component [Desulfonauticus sp.]